MNIKIENQVSLPNGGTEYYGENWYAGNIKIAQSMWSGPEPYSRVLWPRYFSEVKRYGEAWFRFRNSYDMVFEILLDGAMEYTQNGITERALVQLPDRYPRQESRLRPAGVCRRAMPHTRHPVPRLDKPLPLEHRHRLEHPAGPGTEKLGYALDLQQQDHPQPRPARHA